MEMLQKIKNRTRYDSAIILLGIYPKDIKSEHQEICSVSCSRQHYSKYSRYKTALSVSQWMNGQ